MEVDELDLKSPSSCEECTANSTVRPRTRVDDEVKHHTRREGAEETLDDLEGGGVEILATTRVFLGT